MTINRNVGIVCFFEGIGIVKIRRRLRDILDAYNHVHVLTVLIDERCHWCFASSHGGPIVCMAHGMDSGGLEFAVTTLHHDQPISGE